MDRKEATEILSEQINKLRKLPYSELCKYEDAKNTEEIEIVGKTGKKYYLEINGVWDRGKPKGNLRIIVSIDDSSFWRGMFPMSNDFIIAPDGSFIGE